MTKQKLFLKNVLAISIYLAGMSMFPSCSKDDYVIDDIEGVVINGITWATRNVDMPGTFAERPESAGMFYQWGKNVGWSTTDPLFASNGSTTWDNTSYKGDFWTEENCPCPKGWRVPTDQELQKLVDAGSIWTTISGITGRKFGKGRNSIFLPAVGERGNTFDDDLREVGEVGNYWSSNTFVIPPSFGEGDGMRFIPYLLFYDKRVSEPIGKYAMIHPAPRGYSVRCVKE